MFTVPVPSYSTLTTHRKCPQQWAYSELLKLEPSVSGLSTGQVFRDIGSWWHALRSCDSLARGTALDSLRYRPGKITTGDGGPVLTRHEDGIRYLLPDRKQTVVRPRVEVVLALATAWWRTLGGETQDTWQEVLGAPLADALERLDRNWRRRWTDEIAHEAPIAVELQWKELLVQEGLPAMQGTTDEVYQDVQRNLIVVRDYKTHQNLPAADAQDDLMDSQLHLYSLGVSPTVKRWGYKVGAVAYDRTRVKPPRMPEVTKAGNLSKQITDYDVDTYQDWCADGVPYPGVKKDGSGAGVYRAEPEVVEKLTTPSVRSAWHQRTLVPLNQNIVSAHLGSAISTYEDTERTTAKFNAQGQADRNLTRYGCKWCDYAALCRAQMMGGPDGDYDYADYGLTEKTTTRY